MLPGEPPNSAVEKKQKNKKRLIISCVLFVVAAGVMPANGWASELIGNIACCGIIIFFILYLSAHEELKKQSRNNRVQFPQQSQNNIGFPQQQPQQVIQQHHHYHNPQPEKESKNELSPEFKLKYAQNLEKARNFEKAAEAYFEIGMIEDSARIRRTYLEKESSTMVNIAKVGDTNIHDSVVMNEPQEQQPPVCSSCGKETQPHWTTCPYCTATL